MSRVGKKPITAPSGVNISVADGVVSVESGDKRLQIPIRPSVTVEFDEGSRAVTVGLANPAKPTRQDRAMWGTTRALIDNMIEGVTKGFQKKLEIVGVGFNATLAGQSLDLKVGYANIVKVPIPQGLDVSVDGGSNITVKGIDKQKVGQFAAVVRSVRKPEPYNGKGIKYSDEVVRRKQGKVFGA